MSTISIKKKTERDEKKEKKRTSCNEKQGVLYTILINTDNH